MVNAHPYRFVDRQDKVGSLRVFIRYVFLIFVSLLGFFDSIVNVKSISKFWLLELSKELLSQDFVGYAINNVFMSKTIYLKNFLKSFFLKSNVCVIFIICSKLDICGTNKIIQCFLWSWFVCLSRSIRLQKTVKGLS